MESSDLVTALVIVILIAGPVLRLMVLLRRDRRSAYASPPPLEFFDDDEPATCTLADIPLGAHVEIVEVDFEGLERRRMFDLGILPGTEITPELLAPGGDPVGYRLRGTLIALRREQAEQIQVIPTMGDLA